MFGKRTVWDLLLGTKRQSQFGGKTQAVTVLSAGSLESDSSLTAEGLPLLPDELNKRVELIQAKVFYDPLAH